MVVGEALRGFPLLGVALVLAASCGGKARSTTDGSDPGQGGAGAVGSQGGSAGSVGPSSGGAAIAGRPGMSSGGAQSAGSAGMAGGAGTSTGGGAGAPASATCAYDEDCRLFACCADCEALAADEPDPFNCALVDCAGRGCDLGLGATSARCVAGRCVLNHSCNTALLIEPALPAPCPAGQARVVNPDGAGGCVPLTECGDVGSCAPCNEAGLFCTTIDWGALTPTGSFTYHCVSVPPECHGEPSCECMQTCGFEQTCSGNGQSCASFCPNC